jgi:UDP-N-acetylmuramyl-tripeptide synthetase
VRRIGVTGTDGKTSTVHMLGAIGVAENARVLTSSSLGVWCDREVWVDPPPALPDLLAAAERRGVDWAVLELTSRALAEGVADTVGFDAGVLTNVTQDHLDIHGTVDAYVAAKARLFARLLPHGIAVLPGADAFASTFARVVPPQASVIRYGGPADRPRLAAVELSLAGTRARFEGLDESDRVHEVALAPIGRCFAHDALAAATTACALGVPAATAMAGLAACERLPARFEVVARRPLVVIDFAHTAAALRGALETARAITRARVLLVFGAGGDRMPQKRAPMGRAAAELADMVWITSDNPRSEDPAAIADAIAEGWSGVAAEPPWIELHRPTAIESAIDAAGEGDLVLVAGMGADAYSPAPGEPRTTDAAVVRERLAHSRHDGC